MASDGTVSVVIPVYNAEEKLASCLESVLSQDYRDLQVILVNDGSRDASLSVCQSFAASDPRVMVIDQPNRGPGGARNTALKEARGTYVQFVDSDDLLLPGAISSLVNAARGLDGVIARFVIESAGTRSERGLIPEEGVLDRRELLREMIQKPGSYYFGALWNKIYKREVLETHGLRFDESFAWGEDLLFNIGFYGCVGQVGILGKPVYNYKRTASGQTFRTLFRLRSHVTTKAALYRALRRLYSKEGLDRQYRRQLRAYPFSVTLLD